MQNAQDKPYALLVTRNLPPLVGGMERLVWHIADALRAEYRVHVVGPKGCTAHLPTDISTTEVPLKPMWLFLLRAKLASLWQAVRLRPKLVFAGSGLTAPFAWLAASITGAHCVVYLHGLDIEANHPIYRLLWRPFLRHCDRVLVNSRFTRDLAIQAGIAQERIAILRPGVDLPDMSQASSQRRNFRSNHGLGDAPLMLYVGRITARKGLAIFVRDILPTIIERCPSAQLVVIGDEPRSALLSNFGERTRVEQTLEASGLAHCTHFLGELSQDDPELSSAYFACDVHVFPVQARQHDNEGFGMVALEAAAHGLPTVAFAAGGVGDAVNEGVSGHLIASGNVADFAVASLKLLQTPLATDVARAFAARFAWEHFGDTLLREVRA